MKAILGAVSMVLVAALLAAPAGAGRRDHKFKVWMQYGGENVVQLAQEYDDSGAGGGDSYPISEADAADIAQNTQPGAKVLKVKLLPSGVYAVTLKQGGNVSRVMVSAKTGSIL